MKRLIPIACFSVLAGCVPHRQWRTQAGAATAPEPEAAVEQRFVIPPDLGKQRLYSLAFVEFKNSGEPWQPQQLQEALRAIDDADRRSDHRAIVITFIHGWKNNARQENNNVHDFRQQLNSIAGKYCPDRARCGVVGIYIAWSGDMIRRDFNTLRTLTYFPRRNAAADVALDREAPARSSFSPL